MNIVKTAQLLQCFNFSIPNDSGAVGSYQSPLQLPANACITDVFLKCNSSFASAGDGQFVLKIGGLQMITYTNIYSTGAAGVVLRLIDSDYYNFYPNFFPTPQYITFDITGAPYEAGAGVFMFQYCVID